MDSLYCLSGFAFVCPMSCPCPGVCACPFCPKRKDRCYRQDTCYLFPAAIVCSII